MDTGRWTESVQVGDLVGCSGATPPSEKAVEDRWPKMA